MNERVMRRDRELRRAHAAMDAAWRHVQSADLAAENDAEVEALLDDTRALWRRTGALLEGKRR